MWGDRAKHCATSTPPVSKELGESKDILTGGAVKEMGFSSGIGLRQTTWDNNNSLTQQAHSTVVSPL